jgi:N-acetylmuramoyl-L-alanine amidase
MKQTLTIRTEKFIKTTEMTIAKLKKREHFHPSGKGKFHETTKIFKGIIIVGLGLFFALHCNSAPAPGKNKTMVVVIDPGHGGKDPGAVAKGIQEKDVVLAIGLKLGKYINENFPDVKVVFTRNTDVFVPLIDRSRIANRNKADLFISLHANTCGTPSTGGTETFILGEARLDENFDVAKKENSVIIMEDNYKVTYEGFDPNSAESYIIFANYQESYLNQSLSFADDIQRQFKTRLDNSNRGVKQAGFLVLRQSSMPSVLVETGFVSNPADANKLKSEEGQHVIAHSILEAFKRFRAKTLGTPISKEHIAQTAKDTSKHKTNAENKPQTVSQPKTEEAQPILAEKKDSVVPASPLKVEETINVKNDSIAQKAVVESATYYTVQIGANTTPVEPNAANFKGIKDVRREKSDKYYRYYVGKEGSLESIAAVLKQIKAKFSQAFVVYFVDGKRTIINADTK